MEVTRMNNILNFAVVGVGGIGQGHVSAVLNAPNANLAAVCDPKGEEIWEYRRKWFPKEIIPDVPLYTDFDEMLQNEKLEAIIRENDIREVTVARMEVPCCGGLEHAVKQALQRSGRFIPWRVVTIGVDGRILED